MKLDEDVKHLMIMIGGRTGPNVGAIVRVCAAIVTLEFQKKNLLDASKSVLELGRKDTSNQKYDGYYKTLKDAIALAECKDESVI
jgi:hypothetical protein